MSDDTGMSSGAVAPIIDRLRRVRSEVAKLTTEEFHGLSQAQAGEVAAELELLERATEAVQVRTWDALEADGLWAASGYRSFAVWLRSKTGRTLSKERSRIRTVRALRDDLPHAGRLLRDGVVGSDHVEILRRHARKTEAMRSHLADPEMGEEFLLQQARRMPADIFSNVVKAWAIRADPEAADRGWRDEGAQEELFCSPVSDGYAINGWLSIEHGQALDEALRAVIAVPSAQDDRTPATRRAHALVHLARRALDSGELQPGARQRPHIGVQVDYTTIQAILHANPAVTAQAGVGPDPDPLPGAETGFGSALGTGLELGSGSTGEPACEDVIDTRVDYSVLNGVAPAQWPDGSPVPHAQLIKLLCAGEFGRVIFGPDGEILDSGRLERLFTAGQTRAIIARDKHCQFPDCTAPPGEGEIHHSIWWYDQGGRTRASDGVLLCWAHHDYVHQRGIRVTRAGPEWVFIRESGEPIRPTEPPGCQRIGLRSPSP